MLPLISREQQNVINALENDCNVICNSVAGSGKTTCNLHIARHFENQNILLLTYNSKLKIETRERIIKLGLTNIEAHSYHSFCVKYYHDKCFTDTEIKRVISVNMSKRKTSHYDIIILDESQDITPLYFQLIYKIFLDNCNKNTKIVILGDEKQCIFDFMQADQRFLTFADIVFTFNSKEWKKCKLSESFRITYEMSEFINKCVLNDEFIFSNKITNIKPRYIICDAFAKKGLDRTLEEIKYYLDILKYSPNDIFIIAPSVKNENSPVRLLENKLKIHYKDDVPIYVPISDDEVLDKDILVGKLVFSTFHQTKGLERKVVVVFHFDNSYFMYYNKEANPNTCPNQLYVATTRSLEHLTLFHHYENDYLPFLNQDIISKYCYFEKKKINIPENVLKNKPNKTNTTDLIRHLPQSILDACYDLLEIKEVRGKQCFIDIPVKIKENYNNIEGYECVSEITGVAIPSYYEWKTTGKMDIYDELRNSQKKSNGMINKSNNCMIHLPIEECDEDEDIQHKMPDIKNGEQLQPQQLLYIANLWISKKSGFLFKINQIKQYDWLTNENLQLCMERMNTLHLLNDAKFENKEEIENVRNQNKELRNRKIVGVFDYIDHKQLFEFKCVQKLENEHFLQLAVYMYINKKKQSSNYKYYLYNILSDEMFEIQCSLTKLVEMIDMLIIAKYYNKKTISDEDFIQNIKSVIHRS